VSPGYIASLILAGLTLVGMFVAFFVLLFVGAIGGLGESAKYGRVALPGSGTVELPAGEVSVFYEEHVSLGDNEDLNAPPGFRYMIAPAGGGPPLSEDEGGFLDEEVSSSGTTRVRYGKVDVPAEGSYVVEGSFRGAAGPEPAITFGDPITEHIFDRVKHVLYGLIGFALAILIALITFVRNRLVHEDERVTMPPDTQ
jgi:hypothetical protein